MVKVPEDGTANRLAEDCRRCPALVQRRAHIAWGNGPLEAAIFVVGEAPGPGDAETDRWRGGNSTGLAYTSAHSGRRIRGLLSDLGYGREACYFTNAVKCFPGDGDGNIREPTPAERANCRPYLERELQTVEPAVVLATGKHATTTLMEFEDRTVDRFLDHVLDPRSLSSLDTTVLPLLHPSYRDVWLPRIGHTSRSYRRAIGAALDCLVDGAAPGSNP